VALPVSEEIPRDEDANAYGSAVTEEVSLVEEGFGAYERMEDRSITQMLLYN
jgi:hypothetical protein